MQADVIMGEDSCKEVFSERFKIQAYPNDNLADLELSGYSSNHKAKSTISKFVPNVW